MTLDHIVFINTVQICAVIFTAGKEQILPARTLKAGGVKRQNVLTQPFHLKMTWMTVNHHRQTSTFQQHFLCGGCGGGTGWFKKNQRLSHLELAWIQMIRWKTIGGYLLGVPHASYSQHKKLSSPPKTVTLTAAETQQPKRTWALYFVLPVNINAALTLVCHILYYLHLWICFCFIQYLFIS